MILDHLPILLELQICRLVSSKDFKDHEKVKQN